MNTKNLLVFFLATVCVAILAANVSAADISNDTIVTVDGVRAASYDGLSVTFADDMPGVVAGSKVSVVVTFTATQNDTDVTLEAEIEGEKAEVREVSKVFDVESGVRYRKVITLEVPYELKDDISQDITLSIELDGKDYKTTLTDVPLRVQRPSYNTDIKSVSTSQFLTAGEKAPVDIVLKNIGYNDLDDLYVTAKITELGIEKNAYFGDLANLESCEDNCDEDDTVSGRIYLDIPYDVKDGAYTLEVSVKNDDTSSKESKQIVIQNDFSNVIVVSADSKTVAVGENAEYELLLVNPTNKLAVYRVVTESSKKITSSASETVVAVPAGTSKAINVIAVASDEGEYNFNVNVLSGEELVGKTTLRASVEGQKNRITDPIVVLTIVLAVIFLVLLVVLIVLLGKKPKTEDFGESYY